MDLKNNIAAARKKLGFTQEQLAEKCEVSRQAVTKWESGESEPTISKLIMLAEIFGVSIDELVTGNTTSGKTREDLPLDYRTLASITGDLTTYGEYINTPRWRHLFFELLYDVIKTRYFDSEERTYDEYLIANSTKEEREKYVKMLMFESEFAEDLFQEYVDGKCELGETFEKVEKAAKEYFDEKIKIEEADRENREKNNETKTSKIRTKFSKTLFEMKMFENFNEKKLEEIKIEVDVLITELDPNKLVERLMIFYMKCAEEALDNKDADTLNKIYRDWRDLRDFILERVEIEE